MSGRATALGAALGQQLSSARLYYELARSSSAISSSGGIPRGRRRGLGARSETFDEDFLYPAGEPGQILEGSHAVFWFRAVWRTNPAPSFEGREAIGGSRWRKENESRLSKPP